MNNIFKKIIMLVITIAIFLAPISPVLEKQNNNLVAGIQKNTARAQTEPTVSITIEELNVKNTYAKFKFIIHDKNFTYNNDQAFTSIYVKLWDTVTQEDKESFTIVRPDEDPNTLTHNQIHEYQFENLTANRRYRIDILMKKSTIEQNTFSWAFGDAPAIEVNTEGKIGVVRYFTTAVDENTQGSVEEQQTLIKTEDPPYSLDCGPTMDGIIGCIAGIFYFVFWEVSAWFARLAGSFLDFFVYYSTNSDSYTSSFVTEGWKVIRDVANIFFILVLLYIAIKTVLSLNVTNNKKLLSAIVLIALLINFSLFFTQVIIDASNILAKVFYNQVKSVDQYGNPITNPGGQKSISVALVKGYNPQSLMDKDMYLKNRGMFIFITLLLTALTLYTAYMFFVVAILFVSRVVSLWIAMIFAPLAFASYTVPFDIPGFGHKKWWDDLLKAAFLAPIFIFFLYIICLFAELTKNAVYYATDNPDLMQQIMKTMIPFAIIFILLMQAKKLAVEYSGDMGKALSKVGGMVAGVAGGAVMGGAALLGTGVIGGLASKVAGSEGLKSAAEKKGLGGYMARMALRTASTGSKATFDVRKTAVGGALGKAIGADFQSAKFLGLGSKAGGFQGITERRAEAVQKESELYKTKLTNAQVAAGDYKDKNGEKITTASGLNNHRMQEYVDNIGKKSFLSSIAYSTSKVANGKNAKDTAYNTVYAANKTKAVDNDEARKALTAANGGKSLKNEEYEKILGEKFDKENKDKKTFIKNNEKEINAKAEEIIDAKAKNIKMVIGGVGGVGLGAVTGGTGLGIFVGSTLGGVVGGAVGAGALLQEQEKILESERLARANLGKSLKGLTDVGKRIQDLTKALETHKGILETGRKEFSGVFSGNKIDQKKLAQEIASHDIKGEEFKEQMKLFQKTMKQKQDAGDKAGAEKDRKSLDNIRKEFTTHIVKSQTLNELKGVEDKIEDTEQKLFIAKGGNLNASPTKSTPTPPPVK